MDATTGAFENVEKTQIFQKVSQSIFVKAKMSF